MAAPRPWSSLHEDLLRRIILLLTCIADRVRASAVNKHWRLVALQNPSPLPCLVGPSTTLTESYRIFGRFPDPRPSLSAEGRAERFCGSAPGGWFVVASPHGRGHIRCPMMIRAAAISAAPSSGACVVAAITSTRTTMAFCRPGMECWTSLPAKMTARPNAQDLTYHDGWFWAVDSDDDLFCYKAELSTSRQTILHLAYGIGAPRTDMAHGEIVSRYLLPSASGADLLMVRRFISPATGRTSRSQVFRLQKAQEGRPASWRVYKMTRQLLFVGRACFKAFDTGHAGNPGYIYFLDDVYPGGPHQQNQYPCADAGGWGYSIPGEIQRCLPSAPPSDTSSCIWYHH
ncbi:unnamed protein product [Triticum turgidum subsp. durum]|uniref:KIB1-4 beta-propeller domain-containing protein n=1 Tax=Triticum turgidum subsp. durum TaxID=4567 RepID=A0A9R0THA1_TRITD|nr:unnamed protein product [Triticum turgidum subsp. durum]